MAVKWFFHLIVANIVIADRRKSKVLWRWTVFSGGNFDSVKDYRHFQVSPKCRKNTFSSRSNKLTFQNIRPDTSNCAIFMYYDLQSFAHPIFRILDSFCTNSYVFNFVECTFQIVSSCLLSKGKRKDAEFETQSKFKLKSLLAEFYTTANFHW